MWDQQERNKLALETSFELKVAGHF